MILFFEQLGDYTKNVPILSNGPPAVSYFQFSSIALPFLVVAILHPSNRMHMSIQESEKPKRNLVSESDFGIVVYDE